MSPHEAIERAGCGMERRQMKQGETLDLGESVIATVEDGKTLKVKNESEQPQEIIIGEIDTLGLTTLEIEFIGKKRTESLNPGEEKQVSKESVARLHSRRKIFGHEFITADTNRVVYQEKKKPPY